MRHRPAPTPRSGIRRAFDGAVNSERCLLVYENASHNVGGNPTPDTVQDFTTFEFFAEPVRRKDRIMAISQRFVTAFLDLSLKGDETRRSYLRLPVVRSNDGKRPLAPGESAGEEHSKGNEKEGFTFWKGFQSALGHGARNALLRHRRRPVTANRRTIHPGAPGTGNVATGLRPIRRLGALALFDDSKKGRLGWRTCQATPFLSSSPSFLTERFPYPVRDES